MSASATQGGHDDLLCICAFVTALQDSSALDSSDGEVLSNFMKVNSD